MLYEFPRAARVARRLRDEQPPRHLDQRRAQARVASSHWHMDDRGGGAGALNARECDDSTITGPRARSSLSNGEYPKASAQHKPPSAKISARRVARRQSGAARARGPI